MRRANMVRQRNGKQLVHKPLPASVCRHGPDGHGKNGAPYHIKDIVCDMEAAEAMIDMLLA